MTGFPGLAWRKLRANSAVPLSLAVLVLLVSFVVTAWPRALADVDDRQVSHEIGGVSALRRDVISVLPGEWPRLPQPETGSTGLPPDVEAVHGGMLTALEELRAAQPRPLRAMLGPVHLTVESNELAIAPVEGGLIGRPAVTLKVDPYLGDHVELVAGRWPELPTIVDPFADLTEEEYRALTIDEVADRRAAADAATGPMEVALARESAEVLQWEVGTDRRVIGSEVPLRLTGVFEPVDPDGDVWAHNPYSAAPYVVDDLNLGTSATAAAYLHPGWDGLAPVTMPVASYDTRMWFPVSATGLDGDEVPAALAQLRGLTAARVPLGESVHGTGTVAVGLASELPRVLERVLAQQSVTATVLAVVAAGPLGVTLAVFLLGARLVVSRRRSSLALLQARGGSGIQLRTMMAAEALALALPAAAAGAALAVWLVPGRTAPRDLVLAAGVGLAPALLLALTTSPRGLREGRADLGTSRSRRRWVGEVVVVALAAVGVVLLRQRGIRPGDGDADPLLAAVPLLLALATCVVVMRLYPWPVRALQGVLHRRRGVTAFLGAARAVREPAGGLVPAVALVVGVSVALFSAVLSSTVSQGVQGTAWTAVGADLRLSGPTFDPEKVERIRGIEGVSAAATVTDAGTITATVGGVAERVDLLTLDPETFRAVQADAVGIGQLPDGLRADTGDGLPAVLSRSLGAAPGEEGVTASIGGSVPLDVVGAMDAVAGAGTRTDFVVVDHAAAQELTGSTLRPRVLLLSVDDEADPAQVLARVREIEPNALAENPSAGAQNFLASPMAAGMNAALTAAVVLSALLAGVAVVLTQLMGAPQRARLLAVLRTLGLDRRQGHGIVAWELAPLAIVSIMAGAVLGIVVPWVVLGAMDVTALTGGERQPDLALDPLVLGAVLGGLALVAAVAVGISTMMSRRADLATQLRIGDER